MQAQHMQHLNGASVGAFRVSGTCAPTGPPGRHNPLALQIRMPQAHPHPFYSTVIFMAPKMVPS